MAWLSLDEGDNDPTRFLSYLVAAAQTITATIGAGVASALQSPQLPPTEAILTALLNDIATLPAEINAISFQNLARTHARHDVIRRDSLQGRETFHQLGRKIERITVHARHFVQHRVDGMGGRTKGIFIPT